MLDLVPAIADRVLLLGRAGSVEADAFERAILTGRVLLEANGFRPPVTVRLFENSTVCDELPITVSEAGRWLLDEPPSKGR